MNRARGCHTGGFIGANLAALSNPCTSLSAHAQSIAHTIQKHVPISNIHPFTHLAVSAEHANLANISVTRVQVHTHAHFGRKLVPKPTPMILPTRYGRQSVSVSPPNKGLLYHKNLQVQKHLVRLQQRAGDVRDVVQPSIHTNIQSSPTLSQNIETLIRNFS